MGKNPVQFGKATLKKEEKLALRSEFDYVRNSGKDYAGRLMLLVIAECPVDSRPVSRFGVICGKKFSCSSVVRNRARRLLRESFRLIKVKVRPCNVLFIARRALLGVSVSEAQDEMIYLFKKAGLWIEK